VRFTFNNHYFSDPHQGIPKEGYTAMVERMLEGCEVKTGVDFLRDRAALSALAKKVLYTGSLDEYFGYRFGPLTYRTVRFETEVLDEENHQGVAVMNYTDADTPYTRVIEHKHFTFGKQSKTVISREYSVKWEKGMEPYYPVNNEKTAALYGKYAALAKEEGLLYGGRLAEYKYYDMDKVIRSALDLAGREG
jgi:UDP-galactopyranose mutase